MAAMQTLVLPYWAILLASLAFVFTETAIVVDKSASLTPALDDKGSSSASEDFIDLDASPSHVLHEVVDGSKESEIGDTHDSMPLQRPKTTIEVDSDETDDVIHSGSGDDLDTLDLEKNGDKSVLSQSGAEALTATSNTTSTMVYPSSTQANYNPSTSTTSTSATYTTTQSVRLSTTVNTTQPSSANISGATTIMPPRKVVPSSSEESNEEESSGSGSGSGESQCNENNCRYGGVCDLDSEDPTCICDFDCKKETASSSQKPHIDRSVCGSDSILYSDLCDMRRTSCVQQKPIIQKPRSFCIKQKPLKENCTEHETTATWTAWSPWIQSGDVDIRFRSCNITIGAGQNATNVTCQGERMQTRACPVTEANTCVTSNGTDTVSMTYQCKGINPMDTHIKDSAFLQYPEEGKCRYSLYDVGSSRYKFIDWTYTQLREQGKVRQWCGGPLETSDNYRLSQRKRWNADLITMYTPLRACRVKLEKFCRDSIPPCSYTNRDGKRWADSSKGSECLQNLTIGSNVPTGIPNQEGGLTFLCQRFSSGTVYGKMFNAKRSHFATLYDTMRRVPTYSVSKLSVIENKGWPRTPFMVERNLIDKQTQSSWFYMTQTRKKGLTTVSELEKEIRYDQCAMGKYQATPSDYEYTSYRIGQLLPPELVGHRVDDQLASFAMTNTVPMHRDFYVEWKRVTQIIYKYAKEVCRVPQPHEAYEAAAAAAAQKTLEITSTTAPASTAAPSAITTEAASTGTPSPSSESSTESPSSEDLKYGQLYLVAGAVPTLGYKKTVGNGVNVPHLIWMGGCCLQGNETKGFAVYGQNSAQSSMGATSLPQLEILLSQEYTKHTKRSHPFKIKIFPGFQGRCSSAQNDDSLNLTL